MAVRASAILILLMAVSALAGCDTRKSNAAEASASADTAAQAPTTVDPAAPAPGTQAAEAIGADSSSDAPITPPEKNPH